MLSQKFVFGEKVKKIKGLFFSFPVLINSRLVLILKKSLPAQVQETEKRRLWPDYDRRPMAYKGSKLQF
jgi:hypothetical protein